MAIPISADRSSNLLVTQRMTTQLQTNQKNLLDVQRQLSTGKRIFLPSDDAPASLRAISLQRLLERKTQVQTNLATSQSYMSATDTALAGIADLLAEVRASAVSAADSTNGPSERTAVSQTIIQAIKQFTDIGNQNFRGRFLFAGSDTTQRPFENLDGFVKYLGNESSISSYADVDLLLETNLNGDEVFGAISPEVRGSIDLNPILTESTRLANLHGGEGIIKGGIIISDGTSSTTIDISTAETVGDVVELLEANPPGSRKVIARVTNTGLSIEFAGSSPANLSIKEVGGGTTAAALGILAANGVGNAPIIGEDLNPRLTLTTSMRDVLGTRAQTIVKSAGDDNDFIVEAQNRGADYNGVTVQLVDDSLLNASGGLGVGSEQALYSETAVAARAGITFSGNGNDMILTATNPGTSLNNISIEVVAVNGLGAANPTANLVGSTLTIRIDDTTATTVADMKAAIETVQIAAQQAFTVAYDTSGADTVAGGGTVSPSDTFNVGTKGNTGNSGGDANTLFVHVNPIGTTANHIVDAINNDPTVSALFSARNDLKDASSISQAGSQTIDLTATGVTADGSGVEFDRETGIQIINAGQTHTIKFPDVETVEDLLNTLNGSNADVLAQLNSDRNGINLRSRLSGSDFHVGENGGTTATELGVRSFNRDSALADLNHGFGVHTTEGTDFTIVRNDGVELKIDISSAVNIGDVMDLINDHPDNLDPTTAVVARLKSIGNGLELSDDNPVGTGSLRVVKDILSNSANDLGLIPSGKNEAGPSDSVAPVAASTTISFDPPNNLNSAITLTGNSAGTTLNGVQVSFNGNSTAATAVLNLSGADNDLLLTASIPGVSMNNVQVVIDSSVDRGNSAVIDFSTSGSVPILTIRIDDNDETTLQTVVDAINADPTFSAATYGGGGEGYVGGGAVQSADAGVVSADTGNTGTGVVGDTARVTFDPVAKTLVIDVDPTATTANTVVNAINAELTFSAKLDFLNDPTNNGTSLIADVAATALTAGGTPNTDAQLAQAMLRFDPPNDVDTAIMVSALDPGTATNGVQIVFRDTLSGDVATADYNTATREFFIDIDASATTAASIVSALRAEPSRLFTATLDATNDPTNDGSGITGAAVSGDTMTGGTAEVLAGKDVNAFETKGIFNSLIRLNEAVLSGDVLQIQRSSALLDDDIDRLSFSRAGLGAKQRSLDTLRFRLEDEEIELRQSLSTEVDVDQIDAVLALTARQSAFEAALRASAGSLQLTLLDFI